MENIKTFMDFTCPFSYIGFKVLNKLKEEEPSLEYPYILNKDIPKEGMDQLAVECTNHALLLIVLLCITDMGPSLFIR